MEFRWQTRFETAVNPISDWNNFFTAVLTGYTALLWNVRRLCGREQIQILIRVPFHLDQTLKD